MKKKYEKFYVSQVGILIRNNKCLILEFTPSPGHWGLPGGRVDKGEIGEMAFRREIKEELGFKSFKILEVADYDIWCTPKKKPVCAIANLIKNTKDKIILSEEHRRFKWIAENEVNDYNFFWPKATRMIKKGFQINKKQK